MVQQTVCFMLAIIKPTFKRLQLFFITILSVLFDRYSIKHVSDVRLNINVPGCYKCAHIMACMLQALILLPLYYNY